jgi:hypothetical protein
VSGFIMPAAIKRVPKAAKFVIRARKPRAARERFRANGSRECAPDDRLRGYRFA